LITESDVLKCISDEKCREMLSSIQERVPISISNLELTRKQYYTRLHNLIICGLIQKINGGYRLTSFGKVVFDWHVVIRDTIAKEYWRLRAIDMLGSSGIPDSERTKMVDMLIENEKLRQFLSR
jgi:predicted transcriptional regulator